MTTYGTRPEWAKMGEIVELTSADGTKRFLRYGHPYYPGDEIEAHAAAGDEYAAAWKLAQNHLARMNAADWLLQGQPGIDRLDGKRNPNAKNAFHPSPTVDALIKMLGNPSLTRADVLGFLHAPEAAAFDTAWRNRHTTGRA